MASYRVLLSLQAEKNLQKIHSAWRKRIIEKLKLLSGEPFIGLPLVGKLKGLYKIRVHPYRIIYEVQKQKLIVYVIDIGHRGGIYR